MNDFIRFCMEVFIGSISICALLLALNHSGWFTYHDDVDNLYSEWSSNPKFEQAQLVFCGNSQVQLLNDSIFEESLEKKVFSLSCGGCRFQDHLEALRSKIDNGRPELIIIESHSLYSELGIYGRESRNYLPTSLMNFFSIESEWEKIKYFVRDVIRKRSVLETKPDWLAEAILRPREREWKNGFRKSHHRPIGAAELERYDHDWQPFSDRPIEQSVLDDLKIFLAECKAEEIAVMIYESPMYYRHFASQDMRRRGIEQVAAEYNVRFSDLNKMDGLVKNPFYFQATHSDNQHLTTSGADAVSNILVEEISFILNEGRQKR